MPSHSRRTSRMMTRSSVSWKTSRHRRRKNRRPNFETRNFLNHLKCMSRCTVFRLTTKWTRPGLWRSLTPLSSEPCSEMSDRDWSCSSADCSSTKPKRWISQASSAVPVFSPFSSVLCTEASSDSKMFSRHGGSNL